VFLLLIAAGGLHQTPAGLDGSHEPQARSAHEGAAGPGS
jgi:hypothetical protein